MNKFYMVEPIRENVTKKEFDDFIKKYPRKLNYNCCDISIPPSISYNDFELANRWPYSVIANTFAYSDDMEDYYYTPEEKRIYSIMKNYEQVFKSKTGYKEMD